MRRAPAALAAGLLAAVITSACSGEPAPTPAPDPSRSSPANATPTPVINADTGETVTTQPVPEWDEASRAAVLEAAESTMRAFARPDLGYDEWWAELEPLLDPEAARDYAYVDPANVPASEVTGDAELVKDTSAYVAEVRVPTDVGDYTLLLSRADAEAPWYTHRITPPEDL
ncbi:hypothetical protein DT076_07900 [Desertihabitans brevis]|uniref:Lipoprotein n=1 Tax=Desertihabitans brevis TaxID=2268447 RepID=A0A367YVL9_9ACTN|nr:hypothetical protein [Desertihabitans brevis]RCK69936.1 hypothetical protein DT076_07900 [Desertihabitans brevis]